MRSRARLRPRPQRALSRRSPPARRGAPASPGTPRIAYTVRDWPARLGLVAAGLGLAVVPGVAAGAMPPGVRVVAVDDPRPVRRVVVAVTRPERSASAAALVGALREEGASIAEVPSFK